MECKTFEVRDRATFIPMLAIRLMPSCEEDRYLLSRAGFGTTPESQAEYIMLLGLDGGVDRATSDKYEWGGCRTRIYAHDYIIKNWNSLGSGAVIDVEYILEETPEPKLSESTTEGVI